MGRPLGGGRVTNVAVLTSTRKGALRGARYFIRLPEVGAWEEKTGCSSLTNYEWSRTLRKEGVRGMEVLRLDGRLEVEMKYSRRKTPDCPTNPAGCFLPSWIRPLDPKARCFLGSVLATGGQDHAQERKLLRETFGYDSCLLFSVIPVRTLLQHNLNDPIPSTTSFFKLTPDPSIGLLAFAESLLNRNTAPRGNTLHATSHISRRQHSYFSGNIFLLH